MSSNHTVHRDPLVRIVKRDSVTIGKKIFVRAAAILLALIVDALFIFFVTGLNPLAVYRVMFDGTFMTPTRFSWALRDLATLLCIGIALAPAFRMRFWNIGAEGQVLMGGLVTALVMVRCGQSLPTPVLFLVMFLTSVLAGAVWGMIPSFFKAFWNTNETLFTLMMNYVATSIVACMTNIMRGQASSLGKLNMANQAGWFKPFGITFLPDILNQRYTINILFQTGVRDRCGGRVGEHRPVCRHQRPPCDDPYHADLRSDLRLCRISDRSRKRSDDLYDVRRRAGLYGHHRGMACQVQYFLHGADLFPADLPVERCV